MRGSGKAGRRAPRAAGGRPEGREGRSGGRGRRDLERSLRIESWGLEKSVLWKFGKAVAKFRSYVQGSLLGLAHIVFEFDYRGSCSKPHCKQSLSALEFWLIGYSHHGFGFGLCSNLEEFNCSPINALRRVGRVAGLFAKTWNLDT